MEHFASNEALEDHRIQTHPTAYISTGINYTNGPPHLGHAYEAITADVLARWQRLLGKEIFFLTGSDEHGQKISNTAARRGVTPQQLCDEQVVLFQQLNARLLISNDAYIRTTSAQHQAVVHELWRRCAANGDIYLGTYEGWYNEKEECFVKASDAARFSFKDPTTGNALVQVAEPCYYFRLSNYHQAITEWLQSTSVAVRPEARRAELLTLLQNAGSNQDLCISRTSFTWGISVPDEFESGHVVYVWFDALANYISGLPDGFNSWRLGSDSYTHIIGKDISRFHGLIWPAILLSAGLPLPASIFCHGFVNDETGRKLSKSLGNGIDPHELLDRLPAESIRWYLCGSAPTGADIKFSEEGLISAHNSLAKKLGNLVSRATHLCAKICGGRVPGEDTCEPGVAWQSFCTQAWPIASQPITFDAERLVRTVSEAFEVVDLRQAVSACYEAACATNAFLQATAPWNKDLDRHVANGVILDTLEAVNLLAVLISPIVPQIADQVLQALSSRSLAIAGLHSLRNLDAGAVVKVTSCLVPTISI